MARIRAVPGTDCAREPPCVNHRLSPRQGGSWFDVRNLESMCHSCNQKHARDTGLTDVRDTETTTSEDWG